MGLCDSPGMFQEKMNELLNGPEYVRIYIGELLITSNKFFEDHINKSDKVSKLNQKDLKVNAEIFFTIYDLVYVSLG